MPHLAEQDDRRALRAPARRARLVHVAIARRYDRDPGPRDHRPLRGRQGHADHARCSSAARARAVRLGHHARAARGRGGRPRLPLPLARGVRAARRGRATSSSTPIYAGNRYGTLRSELERARDGGIVLEIELQGARQVREALPDAIQVFIAPPSLGDLRERLEGRGTDSPEQIARRLEAARDGARGQRRVRARDRERRAGARRARSSSSLSLPCVPPTIGMSK